MFYLLLCKILNYVLIYVVNYVIVFKKMLFWEKNDYNFYLDYLKYLLLLLELFYVNLEFIFRIIIKSNLVNVNLWIYVF